MEFPLDVVLRKLNVTRRLGAFKPGRGGDPYGLPAGRRCRSANEAVIRPGSVGVLYELCIFFRLLDGRFPGEEHLFDGLLATHQRGGGRQIVQS